MVKPKAIPKGITQESPYISQENHPSVVPKDEVLAIYEDKDKLQEIRSFSGQQKTSNYTQVRSYWEGWSSPKLPAIFKAVTAKVYPIPATTSITVSVEERNKSFSPPRSTRHPPTLLSKAPGQYRFTRHLSQPKESQNSLDYKVEASQVLKISSTNQFVKEPFVVLNTTSHPIPNIEKSTTGKDCHKVLTNHNTLELLNPFTGRPPMSYPIISKEGPIGKVGFYFSSKSRDLPSRLCDPKPGMKDFRSSRKKLSENSPSSSFGSASVCGRFDKHYNTSELLWPYAMASMSQSSFYSNPSGQTSKITLTNSLHRKKTTSGMLTTTQIQLDTMFDRSMLSPSCGEFVREPTSPSTMNISNTTEFVSSIEINEEVLSPSVSLTTLSARTTLGLINSPLKPLPYMNISIDDTNDGFEKDESVDTESMASCKLEISSAMNLPRNGIQVGAQQPGGQQIDHTFVNKD